jgi:hypothetical protein
MAALLLQFSALDGGRHSRVPCWVLPEIGQHLAES